MEYKRSLVTTFRRDDTVRGIGQTRRSISNRKYKRSLVTTFRQDDTVRGISSEQTSPIFTLYNYLLFYFV